jgi:hypothetical protein
MGWDWKARISCQSHGGWSGVQRSVDHSAVVAQELDQTNRLRTVDVQRPDAGQYGRRVETLSFL